jgi:diguanylate cyclase (GGDEF)-like protein
MPDNDTDNQHDALGDTPIGPSSDGASDGSPQAAGPAGPVQLSGETDLSTPTPATSSVSGKAWGRRGMWAVLAVLIAAAGIAGSLLGAHALAHKNLARKRDEFAQTSAAIAATVQLAIQHQEDLATGASTYFAGAPKSNSAELHAWADGSHLLRRYPELSSIGLIKIVRAPELATFATRGTTHASTSSATSALLSPTTSAAAVTTTSSAAAAALKVSPAGQRPYYCLTSAQISRSAAALRPAGLDYCARTSALLRHRDSGISGYTRVSVGHNDALAVVTPVYRNTALPRSAAARMDSFVGWLREVLTPQVMLRQALESHPGSAVRLRYGPGSSKLVFASGTPRLGAQSATTSLHDGWTLSTFGQTLGTGLLPGGHGRGALIAGSIISLLLGLLIFVLGSGRRPAHAPKPRKLPTSDQLYDPLTGLPSRALTLDRAECMVARAGRQSGLLAGALFIDIDWFKDVNEKLGHAAGDQLLAIVAKRLEGVVRTGDTVGRLENDVFVVLVESTARGARLDSLARRVIESLHKPVDLDGFGPQFFATASIGVAFGRYETSADLLRDAQLALHAAKAAGKDRYTLFNANMRSVIESRGVLEAELNTALAEKQFFLLYQPIFDLKTRKVVALEALIRWMHPKRGGLVPAEFLPLAEETGLIVPIGRWVLEEACGRAAAWNVAGHPVGISVKVSANQLNRDGFITDVRRALQQSGIEPELLTLEIAETTVMRDLTAVAERLAEIKQLGVRVAIDDFGGSGYARHSDLQRIPLDFLRVDRSSLAASDDEDYRSWLLESILIVGRDLSLTVIATGIETHEQMSDLEAMGCTMAQGFLMGKPIPPGSVEGIFAVELPPASTPTTEALA